MTTGLKQLKNMNYKQLDNLAEAIRWELVDSVSFLPILELWN